MAPLRKLTSKERKLMSKPWISSEILRKCNERDSILKDIAKETDLEKVTSMRNNFQMSTNEITKLKRDIKKSFYISYFERNKVKSAKIRD